MVNCRAPRFKGFQQQDSHELLRYLLDCLKQEEIKVSTGIIHHSGLFCFFFSGELMSAFCYCFCSTAGKILSLSDTWEHSGLWIYNSESNLYNWYRLCDLCWQQGMSNCYCCIMFFTIEDNHVMNMQQVSNSKVAENVLWEMLKCRRSFPVFAANPWNSLPANLPQNCRSRFSGSVSRLTSFSVLTLT